MDNSKTGLLIKELRRENELTQKELAEKLNITDRAVSKWERGLCAPDISLLEQLAELLGTSTIELIRGERMPNTERIEDYEINAKHIIDFLKNEVVYKIKSIKRKYLLIVSICIMATVSIAVFILWWAGYFGIIMDQGISVDAGQVQITNDDSDDYGQKLAFEIEKMIADYVMPKNFLVAVSLDTNTVFGQDDSDIKVSVVYVAEDNETLSVTEVQAIAESVRYIVPDMKDENISITDSNLNVYAVSGVASSN